MKKLIFSIGLMMIGLIAFSQNYDVSVSGIVTDINSGNAVPNQEITIWTDTAAGGTAYFNTVYSDNSGFYVDTISVANGENGFVTVYTFSCGNTLYENGTYSPNNTHLTFDFQVCTDTAGNCQAMYYYYPTGPNTVQFVDESIGSPNMWVWDFGDGNSSNNQDPEHTYGQMGSYLVTLTIQDDSLQCTSTFQQTVYVNDSTWPGDCSAMWYAYPDSNYMTFDFFDMSYSGNGQIDYWYWSFGDGTSSNLQNPNHTYYMEGDYQVCLTIVDSLGNCEDTYCDIVQVGNWQPECEASFFYYSADSMNNGGWNPNNLQFVDTSFGDPDSWSWDFGDGQSSTEQNPTHYFSDQGYYQVCLTITNMNDSCTSSYCELVQVINDTLPGCVTWFDYQVSDMTVDFTATIEGGDGTTTFFWNFADGTSGTGSVISHTYTDAGMYDVTLTAQDSSGCLSVYQEVIWVGEITFDVYGFVYLDDSMYMADYADVHLMTFDTMGNGLINVETTQIDSAGYYIFTGVAAANCIYFVQAELGTQSAYYGQYVPTYHYNAINWEQAWPVMPFSWGWGNDIMMVSTSSSSSGNGTITGTVSGSQNRNMMPNVEILLLNQNNEPVFYSKTDDSGNFDFSELDYGTYIVYTEIVGIQTIPFEVTLSEEESNVAVNIIVKNGEAVLGIDDIQSAYIEDINSVFPNPVTTNATIEVNLKENSNVSIEIYNQYGQLVSESHNSLTNGIHEIKLNLQSLHSGMYLMKISGDDNIGLVRKFVKTR